ncbi:MAG: ABC transporter substrate-binding protein, partial [Balneolaceae bacterium]
SLESVTTGVHYTLRRTEGSWMITDIILDDVSTADSYQRQFQSVIRQRGFEALFNSLKRRADRIR